jgi:hypothetical protein
MNQKTILALVAAIIVTAIIFGTLNTAVSKKLSSDRVSQPVGNKTGGSNQTGPAPGLAVSDPGAEGHIAASIRN